MRAIAAICSLTALISLSDCAPVHQQDKIVGSWQANLTPGRRTVFDSKLNCRVLIPGQPDDKCLFTVKDSDTKYQLLYGSMAVRDMDWIDNDNFQISLPSDSAGLVSIRYHRVTD